MALELSEYLQNTDGLVTDILNAVGLGERIDYYADSLSEGQSSGWRSLVP